MIAAFRQTDHKGLLLLILRIIGLPDHCGQIPVVLLRHVVPVSFRTRRTCRICFKVLQVDRIGESRHPELVSSRVSFLPGGPDQVVPDRIQLGAFLLLSCCLLLSAIPELCPAGQGHQGGRLAVRNRIRRVRCAAVAGLEHLIQLLIANLQITSSCLCDIGRVRSAQHVGAVLPRLYPEAETEVGIAPDIVVDRPGGLLRRQDQVHAKASSDLGNRDQFSHEVRFFPLQLRKLIDHDQEMRNRCLNQPLFIQMRVAIDIVDVGRVEQLLAPAVFRLDGNQRPVDLGTGQVGNKAGQVRQSLKEVCHSSALVVDHEETDIVRAVLHRQRQQIGLQGLAFSGTCRACHKPVRTMILFMKVQIQYFVSALQSQQSPYIIVGAVFQPAVLNLQLFYGRDFVHLQKSDRRRDLPSAAGLLDAHTRDPPGEAVQLREVCPVKGNRHPCPGIADSFEHIIFIQEIRALVRKVFPEI